MSISFQGDKLNAVDVIYFGTLYEFLNNNEIISQYPAMNTWFTNVSKLPAIASALETVDKLVRIGIYLEVTGNAHLGFIRSPMLPRRKWLVLIASLPTSKLHLLNSIQKLKSSRLRNSSLFLMARPRCKYLIDFFDDS